MSAVSDFSGTGAPKPAESTIDIAKGRSGYKMFNRDIDISSVVAAIFIVLGFTFTLASLACFASGFGLAVTVPLAVAGLACSIVPISIGILGLCKLR